MDRDRKEWPLSVLRALFDTLIKTPSKRKLSPEHEARWWNLAGFFLRPGYGFPLDDFRVKELWKVILGDLKAVKSQECQIQCAICFRRIAGGLNKGQQMQLGNEFMASIFDKKNRQLNPYLNSEKIRALASMERLDLTLKIRLGDYLVMQKEKDVSDYWSLARIGARHLVYGSAGQVVSKEVCAKWVKELLKGAKEEALFTLIQLARRTDHREVNLSEDLINQIILAYPQADLSEKNHLSEYEQEKLFGEKLPPGLIQL